MMREMANSPVMEDLSSDDSEYSENQEFVDIIDSSEKFSNPVLRYTRNDQ